MNNNIIRVMIADDYEIIREGIKRVLEFEDNIRVVAEATDGRDVIEQINILRPSVLLLDMSMPYCDGMDILKRIKNENIDIKVIMLTIENSLVIINKAIEFGADGYVIKESTTREIVEAINVVYNGGKYLDKSLVNLMFEKYGENIESKAFDELSKRELEILFYISKGFSNKKIASELFLSEKTIKNNLTKVFKKIDVKDRVHAAIFSITNNIEKYYKED